MPKASKQRFLLAAFGDAGHAFPIIALAQELVARGHAVTVETWEQWREHVEALGAEFAPAPEYQVFPTRERPLTPYEAVELAVGTTRQLVAEQQPDLVVTDILTLAPALSAELEQVPFATLVPHLYPAPADGLPPFALGARAPRTALGARSWQALSGLTLRGFERGREELNVTRANVGLPPVERLLGGISELLCLVGTFPGLEYPRPWPNSVQVTGPLFWEPPSSGVVPASGNEPVVLIAPSTAHDPNHVLVRTALKALADKPVQIIATWNNRAPDPLPTIPANATVVDWLSYSQTMPLCDVVVTHAGHGTLARALASSCSVVACPETGDMLENAARVAWAGAGVRVPRRLLSERSLELAVTRAASDQTMRSRANAFATQARLAPGTEAAASAVEHAALTVQTASS